MDLRSLRPATLAALTLVGCGPAYAPPNAPATACPQISSAEFDAAVAAGATRATATVGANGVVTMQIGPGVVHCATFKTSMKPCRRPNDLVIRYTLADGEVVHVRAPAGKDYRFRVAARPTTCEILDR
jgi:hypothetical protein